MENKYWQFQKKYNEYDLSGDYGICFTTKNEPILFDLEDYDKIKDYCWYIDPDGYARTNVTLENGKRTMWMMHSLITNTIDNPLHMADHIHGNNTRLDNRKSNLRVATKSQNNINQKIRKDNSSGYKGINWDKQHNKWVVRIQTNNKRVFIGRYKSLDDAIAARQKAEDKYHGEWSYDNSQLIPYS